LAIGIEIDVDLEHEVRALLGLEFSSMARVRKNDPVCLIGLRLHILDQGSTFHLHTREAAAAPEIARRV